MVILIELGMQKDTGKGFENHICLSVVNKAELMVRGFVYWG